MESAIYRDLDPEVAAECGYFEPKEPFNQIFSQPWARAAISAYDQIIYYPGSFGTFHDGHISVIKRALRKYPGAWLVIAPSNSDYASQKYGAWSELASNKHRYDTIKKVLDKHGITASIDIDPMLNNRCDQNFTDQLDAFLAAGKRAGIYDMAKPPVILCGKDRADFQNLNNYTDKVIVEWFEDTTGLSTSKLENKKRMKKHLILRCVNEEEFNLFCEYFEDQYLTIQPYYLHDEIESAKKAAVMIGATHTNCKEYAGFLPYIKISRHFKNPLENGTVNNWFLPNDAVLLDSDIFTGTTQAWVESMGGKLHGLINLKDWHGVWELLDISDFRKKEWAYPFTDISSRCSMQAFDTAFHDHFNEFKEKLSHVHQ
ncbi:hypothetical protein [Xanthomonas phage X1]|nr:hypothetical protein [Xanthomonas phage X1]